MSYEVLRESVRRLRRALRSRPVAAAGAAETAIVAESAVGDRQALRADGSLIYDGAFQRRSPLEVQEDAVHWAATKGPNLVRFRCNPERLPLLEALWRDMRARGVRDRRLHAAVSSGGLGDRRRARDSARRSMRCARRWLSWRRGWRCSFARLRGSGSDARAPPTSCSTASTLGRRVWESSSDASRPRGLSGAPEHASRASHTRSCSSSLKRRVQR